jgi:hypothetical protein
VKGSDVPYKTGHLDMNACCTCWAMVACTVVMGWKPSWEK